MKIAFSGPNCKLKIAKKGFTLVEILVAILILEVGLLGVATFYSYSFQVNKIARAETTAANLASGVLDEELSKSYDDPTLISVSKTAYSTDQNNPFSNYQKQIDVSCINASLVQITCDTNAYMKKIVVTIYWTDGSQTKNFQTASIKAKR